MTDAQHRQAPPTTLGSHGTRRNLYVVLLAVGLLAVVGGLIGGLVAKASTDRGLAVGSVPRTLSVMGNNRYLFPPAHSLVPDYTGLWIGITVALLGLIAMLAGMIVASSRTRVA